MSTTNSRELNTIGVINLVAAILKTTPATVRERISKVAKRNAKIGK